jgi:hypothetical protein
MKKLIALAVIAVTVLTLIIGVVPVQAQGTAVLAEGWGWFHYGESMNIFVFRVSGGTWDGWHYLNPAGFLAYQSRSPDGVTFKLRAYYIEGWGCDEAPGGGWSVYLNGNATVNRGYGWEDGYRFWVVAIDKGKRGKSDSFRIEVLGPQYYYSIGTLSGGNIKLYR